MKVIEWIKSNKLTTVLILIMAYFLYDNYFYGFNLGMSEITSNYAYDSVAMEAMPSRGKAMNMAMAPYGGGAPQLDVEERMVVTNSRMSLLVSDVTSSITQIKDKATMVGGYMVNQHITTPEGLTSGNITVRVPSDKLEEVMAYLRELSVKVVSENIDGSDVTDEYMDIEERLSILESTKTKYQSILDSAVEIEDILLVTEKMIYVQNQIDSLNGRKQYIEKTAASSLITIYLSTDELELPYAPDQPWRPKIVFKYATRGMIQTLRNLASLLIWITVYAVIWVPAVVVFLFLKKKWKMKKGQIK